MFSVNEFAILMQIQKFIRWDTESRPKVGRWPSKGRICELVGDIHWMSRTNPGHGHAGLNVTSMLWVPTCILAIVHQFQSKQSTYGWMRATHIVYIYFSAQPKKLKNIHFDFHRPKVQKNPNFMLKRSLKSVSNWSNSHLFEYLKNGIRDTCSTVDIINARLLVVY